MRLGYADLAVIVVYLLGITAFGAHFRKSQHSLKDYFLGGRTVPWWAISLSIVSAETSILTIIGTPGIAYYGNLGFLQVVFGYLLARVVISTLLLPHYFKGELFTAYQLIERRFGSRLKRVTAAAFLVIRSLAEGVRVFAIAILVGVVLGTGELASVLLITALTTVLHLRRWPDRCHLDRSHPDVHLHRRRPAQLLDAAPAGARRLERSRGAGQRARQQAGGL